eukprot:scaffold10369_cov211-Skeletonema_marinoi.AAC.3
MVVTIPADGGMTMGSADIDAAPRKVSSSSSGRVANFSVERDEGRDDADIARSIDDRAISSPRSTRGDAASLSSRQSKAASVKSESAYFSSKRSKASLSSLSIKTDYNVGGMKRGRSSKSSGKVSTKKPIEKIQTHQRSNSRNNHSSKKEQASIPTSKRKELRRIELEYWSGLSVRVAMAVIQANGSEKMAQKASNIVLDEGRRQRGRECSSKMMRALSTILSVAVLEAGADQKVALAVVLAVLTDENNENVIKSAESMLFDDSSTIWTDPNVNIADEVESVASSLASTIRSNRSKAVSVTPSMASKRRQLKSWEMQILEKQKAIEEAELRNQEKEREFNQRIEFYEAAAEKISRLAALRDVSKDAVLEKEESTQANQRDLAADKSKTSNKDREDNGNKKSSVCSWTAGQLVDEAAPLPPNNFLLVSTRLCSPFSTFQCAATISAEDSAVIWKPEVGTLFRQRRNRSREAFERVVVGCLRWESEVGGDYMMPTPQRDGVVRHGRGRVSFCRHID